MDLQQAAEKYIAEFQGFNDKTGVPTPEMSAQAMRSLATLAAQSDLPAGKPLPHLDQVVGEVAALAPGSAALFNRIIVDNPEQKPFAKTLEIALAALEKRSPETWKHVLHHTALTMLYYERQSGLSGGAQPPSPAQVQEALTLFVGALGHDIGKVGLDPKLLHKSTRVDPGRFAAALADYEKLVPDYPEKLHDTMFLKEANNGKILFAKAGEEGAASGKGPLIKDIGKDNRRSEECWLDDKQRQEHNAIWQRIKRQAEAHIVPKHKDGWLIQAEQDALTMAQRGTVTPVEMGVIASHDAMSEAFFAAAPVPPELRGVRDIVSMDRFRNGAASPPSPSLLPDIIHTTDVFEALTADRSYRKAYSAEEALKVMDGMAKDGKVNSVIIASMRNNGAVSEYAQAYGLPHSADIAMAPPQQNSVYAALEETYGLKPIIFELPYWQQLVQASRAMGGPFRAA